MTRTHLGIGPISPHTLADQAEERLRAAIYSGALRPGAQLVERELASQLGMSRVPVREALQRLAEEGLVRRTTNRTAFVHAPSRAEVEGIVSLRVVLEAFVAERVAVRWSGDIDASLMAAVEAIRVAAEARDRSALAELDQVFHDTLWLAADHPVLVEMAAGLRKRIAHLLELSLNLALDDELRESAESHARLLGALRKGDPRAAAEAMRAHVEAGLPWLTRALDHTPNNLTT